MNNEGKPILTIVLLTGRRKIYYKDAIESLLEAQKETPIVGIEMIISDNGSNKKISNDIKSICENMEYFKNESNTIWQHIKKVLMISQGQYIVFLHDDDLIDKNFIGTVYQTIQRKKGFVGFGFNGRIIDSEGHVISDRYCKASSEEILQKGNLLLRRYFSKKSDKKMPFPGYVYKREIIYRVMERFTPKLGIYSDVYLLSEILHEGSILYQTEPIFSYRRHPASISMLGDSKDRVSFVKYGLQTAMKCVDIPLGYLVVKYSLRQSAILAVKFLLNICNRKK